jgi:hypothetical protein
MREVPGGRFCDHCNKKVHDLTNGNSLPSGTNQCGRILKPQRISFGAMLLRKNPWLYLQLIFILFVNQIKAQVSRLTAQKLELDKDITDSTQRMLILSGTIIDSTTKTPVPFARGLVFDSQKKIIAGLNTDEDGKFSFKFYHRAGTDSSVSLKISHEGYVPLELNDIPLRKKNTTISVTLDSTLKPISMGRSYAMGCIVATVQAFTGTPSSIDLSEENANPEKFEKIHGAPKGIKTRLDNAGDNR